MKIAANTMRSNTNWKLLPIIYARFSTESRDIYIGQTDAQEGFESRVKTHVRETHYHSIGYRHTCKQQDTYDIQGRLGAHKWLMVPLYFAKDHDSLTHLENNFIRRFGTLNKRVTAKKYKKRFPHRRTRNRRQKVDKNKPMVMPTIDR